MMEPKTVANWTAVGAALLVAFGAAALNKSEPSNPSNISRHDLPSDMVPFTLDGK